MTGRGQHRLQHHHLVREVVVRQLDEMVRLGYFQFPVSVGARYAKRVVTVDAIHHARRRRRPRQTGAWLCRTLARRTS